MKISIDTTIFHNEDITSLEFTVLLYYILGGTGILNEEICSSLWNKSYLIKEETGYSWNKNMNGKLNGWLASSAISRDKQLDNEVLAKSLQELFPKGIKENTIYPWRDSTKIIAERLTLFFKKFGEYPKEEVIDATKRYVESFNGNTRYMQVLKYFILKPDKEVGGSISMLASYLENKEQANNQNWTTKVI